MNDDNEYTVLDHQEWLNATDEYDPSMDEPEYSNSNRSLDRKEKGNNYGLRSQPVAPSSSDL